MVAWAIGIPAWAWAAAALAAGLAAGWLIGRRRAGNPGVGLEPLWEALGKPDDGLRDSLEEAWAAALHEVERQREWSLRSQRLQLKTHVIETEFNLLGEVLEALQDGVVVLDSSERVLFANRMARRILVLGERQSPALDQARASLEILDGVRSVLSADLARTVKSCKLQWDDGGQERTYVVRCLVPENVAAAEVMNKHIVVLEDRTAEETSARAKSEFIYGVSHELKTPLTSIQAALEMLVDDDLSAEERGKLTRLSHSETVRLTRMVQELLDLARVEAGITEFKYGMVAMGAMFESLHELHLPLAERKSIRLTLESSDYLPTLLGDGRLLRQALVNLIGNAVKYTEPGGEVSVAAQLEGDELMVRIRDSGIGIAEDDIGRIFDKFFRAGTAEKSRVQGTGLGLPMARYIIERHQGRIEVRSQVGVGTEFTVFLPVRTIEDTGGAESALVSVDGVNG